jgi:transcriptional regulator with XRE-family HTH domain
MTATVPHGQKNLDTQTHLGRLFEGARLKKGLSRYQLGELLNCNDSNVYYLERKGQHPQLWRAALIAKELDLSGDDIIAALLKDLGVDDE